MDVAPPVHEPPPPPPVLLWAGKVNSECAPRTVPQWVALAGPFASHREGLGVLSLCSHLGMLQLKCQTFPAPATGRCQQ